MKAPPPGTVSLRSEPSPGASAYLDKVGAKWDRLVFVGGGSNKFWAVRSHGRCLETWWGRNGTGGQRLAKQFPPHVDAALEHVNLLNAKLRKGYTWANPILPAKKKLLILPSAVAAETVNGSGFLAGTNPPVGSTPSLREVAREAIGADELVGCTLCSKKDVRYWRGSYPGERGGTVMAAVYCHDCAGRVGMVGLAALDAPLRRSRYEALMKHERSSPAPAPPKPAAVQGVALGRFAVLVHSDDDETD